VNLDLPIIKSDPDVLDGYLEDIDRKLDDLFLGAVCGEIERLRLERAAAEDDAAA
jgi:hypothetical protein